jgi:hypothetical protein
MEEKVCWKLGMGEVMREGPLPEKKTLHEDKRDGGMGGCGREEETIDKDVEGEGRPPFFFLKRGKATK